MRSLRSHSWRWLAAGALSGGLLVGGAWYVTSHDLVGGLTTRVSAQASAATPTANANLNARLLMGEVVGISPDPATFTVRTPEGAETTFWVLGTTIFAAGPDRPYSFSLLKTGDQVGVTGGARANPFDAETPAPGPAGGNGNRPRPGAQNKPGGQNANAAAEPVARRVMVRPAGEPARGRFRQAANLSAGNQNRGSNGSGQ